VAIAGGADVIRQALAAGLVDSATLHVAPVVVGGGTRLFDGTEGGPIEFRRTRLIEGDDATHLGFEVRR
jgi:dihydrofolate reductase